MTRIGKTENEEREIMAKYYTTKDQIVSGLHEYINKRETQVKEISEEWYKFHHWKEKHRETYSIYGNDEKYKQAFTAWSHMDFNTKDRGVLTEVTKQDYENWDFVSYYMLRYGLAYAFEYWVMYDVIFRDAQRNSVDYISVTTFGCGCMIDAWSLVYAKKKLMTENSDVSLPVGLSYKGTDGAKWGCLIVDSVSGIRNLRNEFAEYKEYLGKAIEDTTEEQSLWTDSNVLMFAKILNELPDETFQKLIENVNKIQFNQDEIYVCISHGSKDDKAKYRVDKLLEAINNDDSYEIDRHILDCSPLKQDGIRTFSGTYAGLQLSEDDDSCYEFARFKEVLFNGERENGEDIGILNPDFSADYEIRRLREIKDHIQEIKEQNRTIPNKEQQELKRLSENKKIYDWVWERTKKSQYEFNDGIKQVNGNNIYEYPIKKTSFMKMQVIKLTKKK